MYKRGPCTPEFGANAFDKRYFTITAMRAPIEKETVLNRLSMLYLNFHWF